MPSFKSECLGCLSRTPVTANAGGNHEFLFLDGGRCFATSIQRKAIMNAYATCITRGERIHLVEVKTDPLFAWFVDLDLKTAASERTGREERVLELACQRLCDVVDSPCLVATSVRSEKIGVHVVFPQVHCTRDRAIQLRSKCLADTQFVDLVSRVGNRADQAFDDTVYRKGTGLRVLFSHKRGEPHVYRPVWEMSPGKAQPTKLPVACTPDIMMRFSVQLDIEHQQIPTALLMAPKKPKPNRDGPTLAPPIPRHDDNTQTQMQMPLTCSLLSRFYPRESNSSVLATGRKDGSSSHVTYIRSKSRACANLVTGVHRGATIYFIAYADTKNASVRLEQRCFCGCRKSDNRKKGECASFRHRVCEFAITEKNNDLFTEMFPALSS